MSTLIFIFSLLSSNVANSELAAFSAVEGAAAPLIGAVEGLESSVGLDGPIRYRGVERLLAKFEAEAIAEERSAH